MGAAGPGAALTPSLVIAGRQPGEHNASGSATGVTEIAGNIAEWVQSAHKPEAIPLAGDVDSTRHRDHRLL
jgi:hypothetical protein